MQKTIAATLSTGAQLGALMWLGFGGEGTLPVRFAPPLALLSIFVLAHAGWIVALRACQSHRSLFGALQWLHGGSAATLLVGTACCYALSGWSAERWSISTPIATTVFPDELLAIPLVSLGLALVRFRGPYVAAAATLGAAVALPTTLLIASTLPHNPALTYAGHFTFFALYSTLFLAPHLNASRLLLWHTSVRGLLGRVFQLSWHVLRTHGLRACLLLCVIGVLGSVCAAILGALPLSFKLLAVSLVFYLIWLVLFLRRKRGIRSWLSDPEALIGSIPAFLLLVQSVSVNVGESSAKGLSIRTVTPTTIAVGEDGDFPYGSHFSHPIGVDMPNVKISNPSNGLLKFDIGGSGAEQVIVDRIYLKVLSRERLEKFAFPTNRSSSLGYAWGGQVAFRADLNGWQTVYDLYQGSADDRPMYFDDRSPPSRVSVFLTSEPGWRYSLSVGFFWTSTNNLKSQHFATDPATVFFIKTRTYKEIVEALYGEPLFWLMTENIGEVLGTLSETPDATTKIFALISEPDWREPMAIADLFKRRASVDLRVISNRSNHEDYLILTDGQLLVKRETVDSDLAAFRSRAPTPRVVDYIKDKRVVAQYRKRFSNEWGQSAQLLLFDPQNEVLALPSRFLTLPRVPTIHQPLPDGDLHFSFESLDAGGEGLIVRQMNPNLKIIASGGRELTPSASADIRLNLNRHLDVEVRGYRYQIHLAWCDGARSIAAIEIREQH